MEEDDDIEKFDCYNCGSILSEGERERDKCDTCGRHYHEDLWDEEPSREFDADED